MRVAGLFAGIGGLEVGLAASSHHAGLFCEISPTARAVLAARFPGVPCHPDILELRSLPGDTELLVGGFPCQDLSQAGLTAGIGGGRSGLVGRVFDLLDARPVPWVLLENVSFMLQLDRGRALATLVEAFEARGYRWAYRVVNSLAFLPQRRERVLFLATNTADDPADVLFADDVEPPAVETRLGAHAHGFYWTEGIRGLGWAADAVPTLKNGSTVGIASPPAIMLPDGTVITPDIRDAERLQGFPADWTLPAERVARPSARWSLVAHRLPRGRSRSRSRPGSTVSKAPRSRSSATCFKARATAAPMASGLTSSARSCTTLGLEPRVAASMAPKSRSCVRTIAVFSAA